VVEALKTAFQRRGGTLHEHTPVDSVDLQGETGARGVHAGGSFHAASAVVLAAGCWSPEIGGLPDGLAPPVRPLKGQIVSLRTDPAAPLTHVLRAPDVYLCPKDDGRLLVGATQEEMGFNTTPTAGPVMRLLERAWEAVPSIYELAIDSVDVGLRPSSRDHAPIIGESGAPNLYYATGHFRHGILLAPVTAYALADLIIDNRSQPLLRPFQPARFASPQPRPGARGA
jgi:glycine oxidase